MAVYCLVATRRYKASGEIEIEKPARDSLGLDSALGVSDNSGEDSLLLNIEIQTQSNLLESEALALRVVNELHLENSPDFKPAFNPIAPLMNLLSPRAHPDPQNLPLADRPNRRETILHTFEKNLKVEPTGGTRLIDISYLSKDPRTARAVVNQLMADLVQSSFEIRPDVNGGTSKFIDQELAGIRSNTERLQNEVARMQQQAGIVSLGTTDTSGHEQAYSAVLDQLQQISTTLGEAQTNRILKQAIYEQVKTGDPELVSGLSATLTSAASPGVSSSLNMIQNLRVQEANEKANLGQMQAKFGSAYPKLEESRNRVAEYDRAIHDEIDRMRARAKNDYEIAVQAERGAEETYQQLKAQADTVNDSAIHYAIAREEAESSRKLYEDLLSRSKEAEILQGMKTSDIAIIDPALLPGKPARPRVLIYLAASLFLGVTLGMGLAILADLTDRRLAGVDSISSKFRRTPLGAVPPLSSSEASEMGDGAASGSQPNLAVLRLPNSRYAEGIRALASLTLLPRNSVTPQVIMVTSPDGGEGKTTLVANLAAVLARQGKRVLAIDADLRHPDLHTLLNLGNLFGLTNIMAAAPSGEAESTSRLLPVAGQPDLFALPTGPVSTHPSEVLGRARLGDLLAEFRRHFDCILLDAAPILSVNDSLPLVSHADRVLLVCRLRETTQKALREAIGRVEEIIPEDNLKLVINGEMK
jgi:capsular exopolysaccharide synthesis family protein